MKRSLVFVFQFFIFISREEKNLVKISKNNKKKYIALQFNHSKKFTKQKKLLVLTCV